LLILLLEKVLFGSKAIQEGDHNKVKAAQGKEGGLAPALGQLLL
jgi:hypothetical protein